MGFAPALGASDYLKTRRSGALYVDKTRLVADVLAANAEVLLLPRPRRFGKTLNLSALRYFLEANDEDRTDLFEGLAVWNAPQARAHFQRHPVVWLTFKDVKATTAAECQEAVCLLLADEIERHEALLEAAPLTSRQRAYIGRVLDGTASRVDVWRGLQELSGLLARATGEAVVVLIDEYDTPLHTAFVHGYYDEAVVLFRNLLSGGLKDNPHLFRGVLTGILRVARESIFSGLNNLAVYTVLRPEYATSFGFTEAEVAALAEQAGANEHLAVLRDWYDGYSFGGEVVYNPWSVVSFLASADHVPRTYWVSTSSNELLLRLLTAGGLGHPGHLEALLAGETVEQVVDDNVPLRDLDRRPEAVWSLLLSSGYLKAGDVRVEDGRTVARLAIPNREVRTVYETVFSDWLTAGLGGHEGVEALVGALLAGDADGFALQLSDLLGSVLSFHDLAGPRPERVYHAFVSGLLVVLARDYEVRSNRESGHGRCDVLVLPKAAGRPGVALELKVVREGEGVEAALEAALRQLRERDYAAELRARGAAPVHELAAVFDGKRAWARVGSGP